MKTRVLIGWIVGLVFVCCAFGDQPLPNDLQLVPSDSLPGRGTTWWSVSRWGKFPPSPVNWCAGRTNVLYYRSPSFGTNKIIIDDTQVDYTQQAQATATLAAQMETSETVAPFSPSYGPGDIWLDIKFHTNAANLVDVILNGATNAVSRFTNSVWQLLTKTDLASTNAWTVAEIQVDDGSTNALYFGPFSVLNPSATFFRAEVATNLFIVVATNLPNPCSIDYHSPSNSLILSVVPTDDPPPNFYMLDEHGSISVWSSLANVQPAFDVRIATVKATSNGFTNGDLFFGDSPGQNHSNYVGWLSADGTTFSHPWAALNDNNLVEGLFVDQTGFWSNDLMVVTSPDQYVDPAEPMNVYRIHSPTSVHLVTSISARHLEGLLTLPDDSSRYGPWAGKLLTADQNNHQIISVDQSGSVSNYDLGIYIDSIRVIPTNHDLYCVQKNALASKLLKVPRQFFNRYWGDLLMEQAHEPGPDPILFIVHWNGTGFDLHGFNLWSYYNYIEGSFEGVVFAPIDLPPK